MTKPRQYRVRANALRVTAPAAPAPKPAQTDCVKALDVEVAKVDDSHGVVFGYAIVCKVDGDEYYDTQGDHITEAAMLGAAVEYMAGDRVAKLQHQGRRAGQVIFALPLTAEVAQALDLDAPRTGLIIGMRPDPPMLTKFRSGELRGFSIGGSRIAEEVVDG